jgi:predicted DNA-binding transcriptional regulator YafY
VPIVSTPGQGYTLMPGYFLLPLQFSAEEAVMLLGSDVNAQPFRVEPAAAARQVSRKIATVLDPARREEVSFLLENVRLLRQKPGPFGRMFTLQDPDGYQLTLYPR